MSQHGLQNVRRMPRPAFHFANDFERVPAAVGAGWVAGELLIRQVGVVFKRAGWLYLIDAPFRITLGKFRAPNRRVERRG